MAVIGGGAIGLLIASYIHPKYEVTVYTRTERQSESLQRHGVTCKVDGEYRQRPVKASRLDEGDIHADIYIIAVKQYSLGEIFPLLQQLKGKLILFVQNGMGHVRDLENFLVQNIAVGMVEHGARRVSDVEVEHTGKGSIKIGTVKGDIPPIEKIFLEKNFPVTYEADWEVVALRKLMVNAVINPLTTLYRVENGVLVSNSYFFEMMRKVFEEVYSIIGIEKKEVLWENLIKICNSTGKNKSSMLKDIENKRKTEIDFIVGYVLKEAEKKQIHTPFLTFIYASIKGLEETFAFDLDVQ